MNLILRFDQAQLRIADAAVAWLWTQLGIPLRTILRVALAGMLLSELLAQIATEGRVEVVTLAFGALLIFMFERNAQRFGASPELQRAITSANRSRPFSMFVRLAVWPWTAYSIFSSFSSRAFPLELTGAICFVVLVFAAHALPPVGPRRRRRKADKGAGARLTLSPVRFGGRA